MARPAASSPASPHDERLLRRAIELALAAVREETGGPFGAVVAKGGAIVGEGQNRVLELHDPTAHAEVNAIRAACAALGDHHLRGCVLYTSCEPCPMCAAAAWWARVDAIWYSATRSEAEAAGFDDAVFHGELAQPAAERRIPARALLPGASAPAFQAWLASQDRRAY